MSGEYGQINESGNRHSLAHRRVWEELIGPPPENLHHECPFKRCVHPCCLEPLTAAEHTARHQPERQTCANGHAFTEANTYWRKGRNGRSSRQCRQCKADRQRARHAANATEENHKRSERRRRAQLT